MAPFPGSQPLGTRVTHGANTDCLNGAQIIQRMGAKGRRWYNASGISGSVKDMGWDTRVVCGASTNFLKLKAAKIIQISREDGTMPLESVVLSKQ